MPPKDRTMPLKEELFTSFGNTFKFSAQGEQHIIEWRNTQGGVSFRPQGCDGKLIWFVPEFWFDESDDKWALQNNRQIAGVFEHKHFFRLVAFDDGAFPSSIWLVLRPDASGLICQSYPQRANWKPRWQWKENHQEFLLASHDVLLSEAKKSIENDSVEWQRAYDWAQQSDDERFWSIVSWQYGSAQQWKDLVRAAIQIASLGDEHVKQHEWGIFVLEKPRFTFARLQMGCGRNNHPTPLRLAPLLDLLEFFRPRIDYSRSGCRWKPPFYSILRPARIQGSKPSSHELMQALDLWRDFGRQSNQLPRVEELLYELLA